MPLDSNILSGTSSSATATAISALTVHVWGQLPSYVPTASPDFVWAEGVCGADFVHCIEAAYEEVVRWRRNLFMTPSGKAGKAFIVKQHDF